MGRITSTIRFRITALATLAVVAVLVLAGVALVLIQRQLLVAELDDRLDNYADELAELVEDGRVPSTLPALADDDVVAEIRGPDGERLAAGEPRDDDENGPTRSLTRTIDGDGGGGGLTIVVSAPLEDVTESTQALIRALLVAVPIVAIALAALLWWLVGRTLRPVETMRREVSEIGATDLDRRVPVPSAEDEIARLAMTMNGMLDRLEDATRRQQRFVADASHELRSPLTRMRSELEVDLAHPETADVVATRRSVLQEIEGLQRLVDDLLHLARSDARAVPLRRDAVDLDDVVLGHVRRVRDANRVPIDSSKVNPVQVIGDPDQLGRAVGNLVDNAARHAVSRVTVGLAARDGWAALTVADDGPGIPAEHRQLVFERFTRLDDARTVDGGGTGLGLAIVKATVERHGGTVEAVAPEPPDASGARFVVRLPASPP